jgi:hypothetical protein
MARARQAKEHGGKGEEHRTQAVPPGPRTEQRELRNRSVDVAPQLDAGAVMSIVSALANVTQELRSANAQLHQLADAQTQRSAGDRVGATLATVQVNSWGDDPFSQQVPTPNPTPSAVLALPVATLDNPRLRIAVVDPRPAPSLYSAGSREFRYWVAMEALSRGISFWSALLPAGTTWSTSNPMRVTLVMPAPQLNAFYRRSNGLEFYRFTRPDMDIYSGESPDVVCHELGHAVLDALKPQLFNAAALEPSAFHEAFGDMSSILCALQLPIVRVRVFTETGGRLNVNSRLSRLAEQLGWALRRLSPDGPDRDCLRNAANHFFYQPPNLLPSQAPSNLLSSEFHSFSRVFTGAFLDALARMVLKLGPPSDASILAVSRDMGQLLVDGVHNASITTGYYSQVAAAMIQADRVRFQGRYGSAVSGAFVERGILSVDSAAALATAPAPTVAPATFGQAIGIAASEAHGSPTVLAYGGAAADDAYSRGAGQTPDLPQENVEIAGLTLTVHAPVEERRFKVMSEAASGAAPDPSAMDSERDARHFVEDLIQRRELDFGAVRDQASVFDSGSPEKVTHSVDVEDGRNVLKRNHFACWCCRAGGVEVPICR